MMAQSLQIYLKFKLWQAKCFHTTSNVSTCKTLITWDYQVNTMDADALAPWVTRASAVMILTQLDKWILSFHNGGF